MSITYSQEEEEVFEIYSSLRIDGCSKKEALVNLIIMDFKITPSILDTIKTYDKNIFWSFY
jgi:hypothetical protein